MSWISAEIDCEKCNQQWIAIFEGSRAEDSPTELECTCGHMTKNTAFDGDTDYIAEDGSEYPKRRVLEEMI